MRRRFNRPSKGQLYCLDRLHRQAREPLPAPFDALVERLGVRPSIMVEGDDMAMLRLLARDSGDIALLPAVVVQDELLNGTLQLYAELPDIAEQNLNLYLAAVLETIAQVPSAHVGWWLMGFGAVGLGGNWLGGLWVEGDFSSFDLRKIQ